MRGIGQHVVPVEFLPEPADNTSRYVDAQVAEYQRTGVPVHPEVAREIAARYHSASHRDLGFAAFAGSGTLLQREWSAEDYEAGVTKIEAERPIILDEIEREIGAPDNYAPEVADLWALRYYVQHACRAAGWAY